MNLLNDFYNHTVISQRGSKIKSGIRSKNKSGIRSKNNFGSRSKKDATVESPLKTAAQFV